MEHTDFIHALIAMNSSATIIDPIYLMPYLNKSGTSVYFINSSHRYFEKKRGPRLLSFFKNDGTTIRELTKIDLHTLRNTRRGKYQDLLEFFRKKGYYSIYPSRYKFYYNFPEEELLQWFSEEIVQTIKERCNASDK